MARASLLAIATHLVEMTAEKRRQRQRCYMASDASIGSPFRGFSGETRRSPTACDGMSVGSIGIASALVGKFAADNNNKKKKNNKNSNSYRPTPCLNELVVLVLAFFFSSP